MKTKWLWLILVLALAACNDVPPAVQLNTTPTAPSDTALPDPMVTAAPPTPEVVAGNGVVIGTLDIFSGAGGTVVVLGNLQNTTNTTVENIQLTYRFLDAEGGELLVLENQTPALFYVPPAGSTPFTYVLEEPNPGIGTVAVTVSSAVVSQVQLSPPSIGPARLVQASNGVPHCLAELTNTSGAALQLNRVWALMRSESGQLVGVAAGSGYLQVLEAGNSSPVRATVTHLRPDGIPTQCEFVSDSLPYTLPLADISGLVFENQRLGYDAVDNLHLIASVTNNGSDSLGVALVAGLYDADGRLLDSARLGLPGGVLAPGERMPIDFSELPVLSGRQDLAEQVASVKILADPFESFSGAGQSLVVVTRNVIDDETETEWLLRGEVVNESAETLRRVVVVVEVYDLEGVLSATNSVTLPNSLAPGASAPFSLSVWKPAGAVSGNYGYIVNAVGYWP